MLLGWIDDGLRARWAQDRKRLVHVKLLWLLLLLLSSDLDLNLDSNLNLNLLAQGIRQTIVMARIQEQEVVAPVISLAVEESA